MDIKNNILEAIGDTPLVRLNKIAGPDIAEVYAKAEFMNPCGSVKDRIAWHIIEQAEKQGLIKPGGTIVENTSGNTGLGLAMVAAVKGYKCVFTLPDKMSQEKIDMMKSFGAEVVVTPTDVPGDSPEHYVNTAKRIASETPGSYYVDQYHSPLNTEAHEVLTGAEIYRQTDNGKFDAFVAGTGTGGTCSGVGRYLKKHNWPGKVIGVDPIGSVHHQLFHTGTLPDPHVYKVEGVGEDIPCGAFDMEWVDDVRQVTDKQSFLMARRLVREEGLFAGGSSGSTVHVAIEVARELGPGKKVVVILCDSATRYITKHLSDAWMKDHGYLDAAPDMGFVEELLAHRKNATDKPITASAGTTLSDLVGMFRSTGVSQIPITTNGSGRPDAIVHEVDILRGLHAGDVSLDSPAEQVAHPIGGLIHPKARIEELYHIFETDRVAVVVDGQDLKGIVSQIDLIEFLAATKRN